MPVRAAALRPSVIRKKTDGRFEGVAPNLQDYAATCASFSWQAVRREILGLPGGGLNIAHAAIERHASSERKSHVAFRFLSESGTRREISYAELSRLTGRFANALRSLGIVQGDAVFLLCGRMPELYIAALGALRNGCIVAPLFSAFGPEPIATRMKLGEAKVLVTTEALYRRKVEKIRDELPALKQVILVAGAGAATRHARTEDWGMLMARMPEAFETACTHAGDPALLHFTSGTTGRPKGALHVHEAVLAHYATGRYALDLHAEDVFWCTADPGWITGTSYGLIAPLLHGVTSIVDEAEFDAERWYRILSEERVSVWYTAPTAIRMLMKAGAELARASSRPALRFVASVGEPLNPEAVWWGQEVLGLPVHDNWWQTETGGIMIANFAALDIRPGSMGLPLPGVEARIVRRDPDTGKIAMVETPSSEGELALRAGWPSMFRAYLHEDERYRKCFAEGWYLTGDLAKRDAGGYFWFVGRGDDVIKSSGHLIGPFEVESALMEHPAVAEAGVIGKPDAVVGESVKAFISLRHGHEPSEALRTEVLGFARKRLGAVVAPKEIAFLPALPRTRSGKIMRRLLKARELGLPQGDTSTLEAGS